MLNEYFNVFYLVIAFILAWILGPIIIPLLERLEIGQSVRKEGPKSHYKKSGTPTMGGLIFFTALSFTLLLTKGWSFDLFVLLLGTLGFGLIGFIDDILIVIRKSNDGLTPRQKIIGQVSLALAISTIYYLNRDTEILIPFVQEGVINLGIIYIPFMTFVLVAIVNSVNLTDGLDGLASGITFIVLITFSLIAKQIGNIIVSDYSIILAGSLLGFLIHNFHPAKVFMGDTGSLGLGGAVGVIAMSLDLPLLIPIIGGIYVAEALSVIIQVGVYKKTGKRVFLMSPLHHHFEQKGWNETKVVFVFWTVTIVLSFIGYISIRSWW